MVPDYSDSSVPGSDAATRSASRKGLWARFESNILLNVATMMFVGSCLVMLFEGGSRAFFDSSAFWAEESVRYLMVWAFFLTLGVSGRAGHHIRTDLLVERLGPRLQRCANIFSSVAGIGFCVLLFCAAIPQLMRYHSMGMMTESNLDLPLWLLFMVMPIGAVLLSTYYIRCLVKAIRGENPFASGHEPNGSQL